MQNLVCHICRVEFKNEDLIVPLVVDFNFQSGTFLLHIYTHYMCGLRHYLDNLEKNIHISNESKVEIQGLLMSTLNRMSEADLKQ